MNTVYTFKNRNALFTHLRALSQLASSISNSKLPMFDFDILKPYISKTLFYLRNSECPAIYFAIRKKGFEFDVNLDFFNTTIHTFRDVIQCYKLTYKDGYYRLSLYPQK